METKKKDKIIIARFLPSNTKLKNLFFSFNLEIFSLKFSIKTTPLIIYLKIFPKTLYNIKYKKTIKFPKYYNIRQKIFFTLTTSFFRNTMV